MTDYTCSPISVVLQSQLIFLSASISPNPQYGRKWLNKGNYDNDHKDGLMHKL